MVSRSRAPGRLASGRSMRALGPGRHADHDRPVELLGLAIAERLGQPLGRLAGARDQQQAGRVLVEAMDQPRPLLVAEAQRVEHAVDMALGARAALHREPRRLVERDHLVVAMDHQASGSRPCRVPRPRGRSLALGRRRGRHARAAGARSGRARPGPCPRPACRRAAPGRCAAASAARHGSARGNAAGTSDRAAGRPRRRVTARVWT